MKQNQSSGLLAMAGPILATITAIAAYQVGAAFAKGLFPAVGPQGAAALRLVLGAVILVAIARPWRTWPRQAPLIPLLGLGLSMAAVILMFYLALARLPLGLAISLQFLGPLAIALFGSRRPSDLLWAALAGVGVWCLVGGDPGGDLDLIGVVWALGAAGGWAGYILCGRSVSTSLGASTAAVASSLAALIVLPVGVAHAGAALLDPALLPLALLVALFSTAVPFLLEFYALPRMPARTFAVFMSLEPAFAVLAGLVFLQERLSLAQVSGVVAVMIAAAGAAWSGSRRRDQGAKPADSPPN